jgi:hypothetical protein
MKRRQIFTILHVFTSEKIVFRDTRGRVVGWGAVLRTGRLRVRFPKCLSGFLILPNPSSRTVALGSTQSLIEMSTRNVGVGGIK